jgi:flagellar biosynthesis regulator FlaF
MASPLVSTTLSTVFVSNDNKNRLLISTSADGARWSGNALVGGEQSSAGPAIASFNNRLWTAFISNDNKDILVRSSSDGSNWTSSIKVGQSSKDMPSLCAFNGRLWLAFISNDRKDEILVCSSSDGMSWSNSSKVDQSSSHAPSLCVFNNKLWLAFTSDQVEAPLNKANILICSSSDGTNWSGNSRTGPYYSNEAPSLCAFNGKLWIAYLYINEERIFVGSSSDGTTWGPDLDLHQKSKYGLSLTASQDKMYLGFVANNSSNEILLCTSLNGTSWSGSTKIGQQSHARPAFFAPGT